MTNLHIVPFLVAAVAAIIAMRLPCGKDIQVPVFLMPWYGLTPDIGVNIPLSQYVLILLLVKYALAHRIKFCLFPGIGILLLALAVSIASAVVTLSTIDNPQLFSGGELRNGWFRSAVVLGSFSLTISYFFLLNIRNARHSVLTLFKVYVASTLILCALGVLQFMVFFGTGQDIFPIGMFGVAEEAYRSGLNTFRGEAVLRPCAFAGEPKSLGMFAVAAAIIIIGYGRQLFRRRIVVSGAFFLCLTTIALTQSTSALLSLAVALGIYAYLRFHMRPLTRTTVFLFYTATAALALTLAFSHIANDNASTTASPASPLEAESLSDLLYNRTIGRIEVEDFDYVILNSFLGDPTAWPFGRGLGLAHLFVDSYIPSVWAYYMRGAIVFPKSGLTFFFANGGLVALVLMLLFFARITPCREELRDMDDPAYANAIRRAQMVLLPLVTLAMLRIYIFGFAFFAAAALSILLKLYLRRSAAHRTRQKSGHPDTMSSSSRLVYVNSPRSNQQ